MHNGTNDSRTLWYKDAIIYEAHVKTFHDMNGDGIGDFQGLTAKLDYIASLGVTAIWLLPFYPSPLRDDGYDVEDYENIHPSYGTFADFRVFLQAAHEHGLRVIADLVINHTSNQHPWFQRARTAKSGSPERDFYVWSDTDQKYAGTRIVFNDAERSNWTWDSVAHAYYWHRFFSCQPDLNYDNPLVFEAIADVMRFWFKLGVDCLRLDAAPYICEREGTNNENLPETHAILKKFRTIVDREFPDRILLGEANMEPHDVRAYFGDDDECHMAFHFPLAVRMFSAIAREQSLSIIEALRQTPEIPASCAWATFLCNHDGMTFHRVNLEERDFLLRAYAPDNQARINTAIRKRLAPLLGNDRRKIELLNMLLLSLPGTPVLYYGDEIGMGDDTKLPDRDGLRTPMQWSDQRNGGFSTADRSRLCLPVIEDDVYGYERVNVTAQTNDPDSLLHRMRALIATRRKYGSVFGRGTFEHIPTEDPHILAFLREHEGRRILCLANLSGLTRTIALETKRFAGCMVLDIANRDVQTASELPDHCTLTAYAYRRFALYSAS